MCISLFDLAVGLKRVLVRNGLPVQIINYVTSRCNLRCEHCFYWKELDADHSHELSLNEIKSIAVDYNLKIVEVILKSSACLFASKKAQNKKEVKKIIRLLSR